GIVTTTYAEDLVTSSTGQYSDNVLVLCSTGAINQNTNANGSVIVACPFFIGTVLQGAGSVTSYP
ncbi:MAG TPA: hypothetical protein VKU41_19800, partial [Polyangiaceae bacterium]|nr:hypothetical protein [Polyangiaceae bacterium]